MSSTIRGRLPADNPNLGGVCRPRFTQTNLTRKPSCKDFSLRGKEAPIQFEDDASIAPSGNQYLMGSGDSLDAAGDPPSG